MSNALKSTDTEYRQGFRRLLAGLLLALALTPAAFSMVWFGLAVGRVLLISITLLAAIQMVVHLRFFLHLGAGENRKISLASGAFVLVLLLLMVAGTLWIMTDLDWRMMSAMPTG